MTRMFRQRAAMSGGELEVRDRPSNTAIVKAAVLIDAYDAAASSSSTWFRRMILVSD
jgi:hypothetical protein